MLPSSARYAAVLAGIRIFTGIWWALHGYGKLSSPTWAALGGGCAQILQSMSGATSGVYHDFIVNVVLPNVSLFAHLVAWGETLTGVSLALGLFTRLGGAVGVFLPLNYWLAKSGFAHLDGYSGLDLAALALSLINLLLPTGLYAGIDGIIAGRKRNA